MVLLAAAACADKETQVRVQFRSVQIGAEFSSTARYALAVPQETCVKVYLFPAAATCADIRNETDIAELYVPTAPSAEFGAKFAPPGKPTWATGIHAGNEPPITDLNIGTDSIRGCVDLDVGTPRNGNSGSLRGCFAARVCPPEPASQIAAVPGATDVKISMNMPDVAWEKRIRTAIAFVAQDRVMVFFQDSDNLNCENYRLVPKQGLIEFKYADGMTTFGSTDVAKVAPVHPGTGWSFHYGPDQIQVSSAHAAFSPDGRRILGSIDVGMNGIDPLTAREVYPDENHGTGGEIASGRITGTFDAPICPEF